MVKTIILEGNPISTNMVYRHTSIGGYVRTYMTNEGKQLKEIYHYQALKQWKWATITNEYIRLNVTLFFKDKRKRDWDNYHKLSMDALSGIVWADDSLIYEVTVKKSMSRTNPRIEIQILD